MNGMFSQGMDNNEEKLKQNLIEISALYEQLAAAEEELKVQYDTLMESQDLLKSSEERYKRALEGSNDGVWDININKKKIFISDKCAEILGIEDNKRYYPLHSWIEKFDEFIGGKFWETFIKKASETNETYHDECKIIRENGENVYMYVRGNSFYKDGELKYIAGSITDITQRKKDERIIRRLAYRDINTGLYNRNFIMKNFPNIIYNLKKSEKFAALIFVDMDNFKVVNDTFGHSIGDQFLKCKAAEFKDIITSPKDYVCHLSGDEFLFLITSINSEKEAEEVLEKIKNTFSTPFYMDGQEVCCVTVSMGVAFLPKDGYDFKALLKHADDAMYCAKRDGKNRYRFYADEMDSKLYKEAILEKDLRQALEKEEFKVYYQPKINIKSMELIGMEALVRWEKNGKIIPPSEFISFAEERKLIDKIGEYVLLKACEQNKEWQDKGFKHLRVSVNLSATQLQDINILTKIENILEETGLSAKCLELEVTESMIIKNFSKSIEVLNKLKSLGIKISLDDFGTGYSSLNYLKNLPMDIVKIDKTFIDNIITEERNRFITHTIINLCRGIDLQVVAEGVENQQQLKILREYDCDEVQGYIFSKPLPHYEFEKLLKDESFIKNIM